MKARILLVGWVVAGCHIAAAADVPHTPERGSSERQAICDGARVHVMKQYVTTTKLPQPLVFKIERMEVIGNYCSFQGIPLFKDGSPVSTEYMADIAFDLCLQRTKDSWRVIYDLSSTDVPSDPELKQMWGEFPKEFPSLLLPKFWRDHFHRIK